MTNVISYYPMTAAFRDAVVQLTNGPCNFVSVPQLRNLSILAMLGQIRALKADRIIVAVENDNAAPVVGPLLLLAALSGSHCVEVLWPDNSIKRVSCFEIVGLLMRFMRAQVEARVRCRISAARLRSLPRRDSATLAVKRSGGSHNSILYLDANLSFGITAGGSVGHIKGVLEAFVQNGYMVDYVSGKPKPTEAPGIDQVPVPPADVFAFPPELNYYTFNDRYERVLSNLLKRRRYAFAYQRMSVHNYSGALLRAMFGIPLVLEFNGSEAWAAANWGRKLSLHDLAVETELASVKGADLVVTVSKVLGEQLASVGVPDDRILVYPNCIDPKIFDPDRFSVAEKKALRQRLGIPQDAVVATFIGTFGMWHGVDFLAGAIRRLVEDDYDFVRVRKLHFLLIGDGMQMQRVRERLSEERVASVVTLTGLIPQSEAPAYLATSDIFLSPHVNNPDGSAFFGSPTKLFEYMAMKRPIIASDLEQIGSVLRGQYLGGRSEAGAVFGELYSPGDENGFLDALRKVVADPVGYQAMAERARSEALQHYTWEKHVRAIIERVTILGLLGG
jgi:glycosyltransferase involved in cell wall biosynthesis